MSVRELTTTPRSLGPAIRAETPRDMQRRLMIRAVIAVVALGVLVRAALTITTQFPINDGGLFYAFVVEYAKDWPHLPTTVLYNGYEIPFAYPPLSFFGGAVLVHLGVDPMSVVHYAPIVMNIVYSVLCIAFLVAARVPLNVTLFASVLFMFVPRSYEWLVMGGGLSRGLGSIAFVAAMIALQIGARVSAADRPLRLWLVHACAGLFVGLAVLSHLEWGVLAAGGTLISVGLTAGSFRRFVARSFVTGMVAVVVVLPWVVSVYMTHGLQPFLSASHTSEVGGMGHVYNLLNFVLHPLYLGPFVLLGIYVSWRRRDMLWLALSIAALVLTPRQSLTPAAFFKSVVAGYALVYAVELISATVDRFRRTARGTRWPVMRVATQGSLLALAWLGITALALTNSALFLMASKKASTLTPAQRAAMAWVAREAPGSRFVIVDEDDWYEDKVAEWFPVLANALNLGTVQGSEWLPDDRFKVLGDVEHTVRDAKSCDALINALPDYRGDYDYVWVQAYPASKVRNRPSVRPDCFENSGRFGEVFRNPAVVIFRKRAA